MPTTTKLRAIPIDGGILVLGTDQIIEARDLLPDTFNRYSSQPGLWVRRQGEWQGRDDYMAPKDARPGVLFVGRHQ